MIRCLFDSWYVEYRCRCCRSPCLVGHGEGAAKHRECRDCFSVPQLDRERVDFAVTSLLWAVTAAPLDLPSAASEGKAETARGAASAPSGAEVEANAERGLAPDRAARAHEGGTTGPTENERRSAVAVRSSLSAISETSALPLSRAYRPTHRPIPLQRDWLGGKGAREWPPWGSERAPRPTALNLSRWSHE